MEKKHNQEQMSRLSQLFFQRKLIIPITFYSCLFVFMCVCFGFFPGVLHHSGRPDLLLQERQTSLQETCSHTENIMSGLFPLSLLL